MDDTVQKQRCREAAKAIAQAEKVEAVRGVLDELGLSLETDPPLPGPVGAPANGPQPISIWQPVFEREWFFQRGQVGPFGDHYAARPRFAMEAAPRCRRVCLFGESAAAGYLYAPHMTPALVLEHQLQTAKGGHTFEVIDLARTNERLPTLVETFERAMQLKPEIAVIFAGNNWGLLENPDYSPLAPGPGSKALLAEKLAQGGLEGMLGEAAKFLVARVTRCFNRIAELAASGRVRVIVVVPEVNLADWQSLQPPPWMEGEKLHRWFLALERAREALGREAWAETRTCAMELLSLDEGTCPTPFLLLGLAYRGEGRFDQAREAFRAQVDAVSYPSLCFLDAPRAGTLAQNMLRRMCLRHGFEQVDLTALFAASGQELLPGRKMFLDYCHLTFEGMRLAMAGVSEKILPTTAAAILARPAPQVSPAVHALAYFGAAVHGAHRENALLGKASRVAYWCARALEADPSIKETFFDYVAARLARVPAVLTPAQDRNQRSAHTLLMQHGWRYDHLDGHLILGLLQSLTEVADRARLTRMLQARAVGVGEVDLVDPYYLFEPLHRFYPEVMGLDHLSQPVQHRSPWPFSRFCLIAEGRIQLALNARLSWVPKGARRLVHVLIDGEPVGSLLLGAQWSTRQLCLDPVGAGLHVVTLCWPLIDVDRDTRPTRLDRLARGQETPLHPLFGEIFSLKARQVPDSA